MRFNKANRKITLTEGTKYDKLASKIISNSGLFSEEVSDKIIDGLFRQDIHAFVHSPSWLEKYLKGIARMLVEEAAGDKEKAKEFLEECPEIFDRYLTWVKANREKIGAEKLDDAFVNKMHYQDIKDFLDKIQSELDAQSKDELAKMQFKTSDYTLVPIDSYEQMHKLYGGRATGDGSSNKYAGGGGTAWCHTNSKNVYDNWTKGGRKFFILQKNNWKDIPFNKASNEKNPKDAYGNSLIAISVDRKGNLKNATLRCNHVGVSSNADNQYETYAELSKLAGFNVEEEVLKNLPEEQWSDFIIEDGVLVQYEGDEDYVEIPSNVVRIGGEAFRNNENIEIVKIPNSVTHIGAYAFYNCSYLRSISIPDSVIIIGIGAFSECESLTNVVIPNSVTSIGAYAFYYCSSLTSIEIPSSVTSIGNYAFHSCDSLTSIEIPNSITSIEESTFSICSSLTNVIIPNSVTSIGASAFEGCSSLTNIEIPDSVTTIGEYTFYSCDNLVVKTNNPYVIQYCKKNNLRYISEKNENLSYNQKSSLYENLSCEHIEDFIEDIYDLRKSSLAKDGEYGIGNLIFKEMRALGYLDELKDLKDRLKSNELSLDESLINESKEDIQKFIDKFGEDTYELFKKSTQRLKNNNISTDILYHVKNTDPKELKNILFNLEHRITSSEGELSKIGGKYNYLGEKGGYKVYQPLDAVASMNLGVNTGWCTTGRYGHYGDPNFKPSLKDAEKHWNDYTKRDINFYYFLDPVTMYGKYAVAVYPRSFALEKQFGNQLIKETNVEVYNAEDDLAYGVLSKLPIDLIPQKIIYEYKKLPEFEIKDGVLLKWNSNNSTCIIPSTITSIGDFAFSDHTNLTDITIPNSVTTIEDYAFLRCTSLTNIKIPNSVTSIGNNVFSFCTSLTSIEISNDITSIERYAFISCSSLTCITIPDGVKSIGQGAFSGCSSLTNIEIPTSVIYIGYAAFSRCSSLTSIEIPANVKSIEDGAFFDCSGLKSITIPNSITSIGDEAFARCDSLSSITIPSSVTSIGDKAFSDCDGLTSIVIPNSVTYIGDYAFDDCNNLIVKTNNEYVIDYCKEFGIEYTVIE